MQSIICEKSEKKRILGIKPLLQVSPSLAENKLHVFSFNYRLHFSPEWQLFCRPSVANSRAGTASNSAETKVR